MSDAASAPPPTPQPVEIEFDFTFDEFREGLSLRQSSKRSITIVRRIVGLLGWLVIVSALYALYVLSGFLNERAGISSPASPKPQAANLWLALLPSALAVSAVALFLLLIKLVAIIAKQMGSRAKSFLIPARITVFVVIYFGVRFAVGALVDVAATPWSGTLLQATILASAPWAALLVLLTLHISALKQRQILKQWNTTLTYHRPRKVRIDSEGMTVDDGISRLHYRWPFFKSALETPNLLVLIDEAGRRHMLPKCAFGDEHTSERTRSFIASNIRECRFTASPRGFPVQPMPVLPLPEPAKF